MAAGEPAAVPCMLKCPAQGSRWRAGRLLIDGSGPLVWRGFSGKQESALSVDLHHTGTRSPSFLEAVVINPRSRIVECGSADGKVLIAVMPEELHHVIEALKGV